MSTRNALFRVATIARSFGATALIALVTGCVALPSDVSRQVSVATTDVAATQLAAIVDRSMPVDAGLSVSGLRLLPAGDQALEARLALARAAEKSIDAQYYLLSNDESGRQFVGALRDAALRGVRVRLLVDDLYAAGKDPMMLGLAAVANVEVRIFNPIALRSGSVASRVLLSLHDFSRINRRMHNKLFVADNVLSITGGRNIADEYFDRSGAGSFIDMDILTAGPAVQQLSAVFDDFWNSEMAYPVQSIAGSATAADRARLDAWIDAASDDQGGIDGIDATRDALGQASVGAQLHSGRLQLSAGSVQVVADAPTKARVSSALDDGSVMQRYLALLDESESSVLVVSPYFVPGRNTIQALESAAGRAVRIEVMTNSLATTDEPLVHFGYARYRKSLVKLGVSLYELMPGDFRQASASGYAHGSQGRLHAKLAVVDQRKLFIGSMNTDRRSAHCNTELGLIVDSPAIAQQVATLFQGQRLPSSYLVRAASNGADLEWVTRRDGAETVHAQEPDAGWARQLQGFMTTGLISEELL